MLVHQRAVRSGKIKPKNYVLRSIKVLARVRGYLVMRFIEGESYEHLTRQYHGKHLPEEVFLGAAYGELRGNLDDLLSIKGHTYPQLRHIIIQNTNPQAPLKGKWVFYIPYDLY